jgi:DNA-directed RNA polymerase delta subunit
MKREKSKKWRLRQKYALKEVTKEKIGKKEKRKQNKNITKKKRKWDRKDDNMIRTKIR